MTILLNCSIVNFTSLSISPPKRIRSCVNSFKLRYQFPRKFHQENSKVIWPLNLQLSDTLQCTTSSKGVRNRNILMFHNLDTLPNKAFSIPDCYLQIECECCDRPLEKSACFLHKVWELGRPQIVHNIGCRWISTRRLFLSCTLSRARNILQSKANTNRELNTSLLHYRLFDNLTSSVSSVDM